MERLRSDVAIIVSGKKPVTAASAEATARQGRRLLLQGGMRCPARSIYSVAGGPQRVGKTYAALPPNDLVPSRVKATSSSEKPIQPFYSRRGTREFFLSRVPALSRNNVRTMGEAVVSDVAWASVNASLASALGSAWDSHTLWVCSSHARLVSGRLHRKRTT